MKNGIFIQTIDVQYSQKAVFNFEKDSNHQNHSSGALHLVKKSSPPIKFPICLPPPPTFTAIWKTLIRMLQVFHSTVRQKS